MNKDSDFHKQLKIKTHNFIIGVYKVTDKFPKSELYGSTSQIRRASVSVMLNYLEGFARFKIKVKINFFEISFGSAKECKYLVYLSFCLGWIDKEEYNSLFSQIDEISGMLYSLINGLNKDVKDI